MDREQLVEAMADVLLNGGCGTTTECEALACAALAVAEPVVREWCAEVADARVSSIGTRTENGTARTIAAAIRAGSAP